MSQKTSIALTDAASPTPIARSFAPARKDGDLYTYHNRASGIVAGYDALTIQCRPPSKSSKATVVSFKLTSPILEQTSASTSTGFQPVPTVAFNDIFKMEFVLHERSSTQNRKDLLAMARDLIDEALVTECVESYDFTYY